MNTNRTPTVVAVYIQPSVSAMTMGATATASPPASVPATSEAVPPVKAGF
jgi:hypothetical protein